MKPPSWRPPAGWLRLSTVDAHTGGEPFRVVTGGLPELPGATILERRRYAREHLDPLRRALMLEPRGHPDMYGCYLTPPVTPGADLGVIFLHNEGYSTMCGHGVIALATVVLETGMLPAREPLTELTFDTPAGPVAARARVLGGRVEAVSFCNVPSFAVAMDRRVEVPGLGTVTYDLAFGGAFYAVAEAAPLGLELDPRGYRRIIEAGVAVKAAVAATGAAVHPEEPDLSFLYGVIFTGPPRRAGAASRNACVFAGGQVDRSPTGTGVSARLALGHARGDVAPGEDWVVESILGTRMTGRVVGTAACGPHPAVIPEIEGRAHLTGRADFVVDPEDPLAEGFELR